MLAGNAARQLPETAPRALQLPLDSSKVVTLIGIRRSGKTYLLYDTMRRLEALGVERRRMLYLNFEDDRLLPVKARELDLILRAHEELFPETIGQRKYLFLGPRDLGPGGGSRSGAQGGTDPGGSQRSPQRGSTRYQSRRGVALSAAGSGLNHDLPPVERLGIARRRIALHAAQAQMAAEQLLIEPLARALRRKAPEQGGDLEIDRFRR